MEIKINKEEVYNYFKELISNKETWEMNQATNGTTVTMIHGALTFANAFGLITNDEQNELLTIEIPTETEEKSYFTCSDCPYHYYDEGEAYPTCHHNGDDVAPCEYEEPEEIYEYDEFYDEESWDYEERNYNLLYHKDL